MARRDYNTDSALMSTKREKIYVYFLDNKTVPDAGIIQYLTFKIGIFVLTVTCLVGHQTSRSGSVAKICNMVINTVIIELKLCNREFYYVIRSLH